MVINRPFITFARYIVKNPPGDSLSFLPGPYFICPSAASPLTLLMAEILHQLISSLSHYLRGFIHPRSCRISSINNTFGYDMCYFRAW